MEEIRLLSNFNRNRCFITFSFSSGQTQILFEFLQLIFIKIWSRILKGKSITHILIKIDSCGIFNLNRFTHNFNQNQFSKNFNKIWFWSKFNPYQLLSNLNRSRCYLNFNRKQFSLNFEKKKLFFIFQRSFFLYFVILKHNRLLSIFDESDFSRFSTRIGFLTKI